MADDNPTPKRFRDDPALAPMQPGVITLERVDGDDLIDEELWSDDSGDDYSGWSCVGTDPFPCPADGCTFVARHMTAAHLIIVWPESDDPALLRHAAHARQVGRNPKVMDYEPAMGPACSYYQWEAAGNPVHGFRAED